MSDPGWLKPSKSKNKPLGKHSPWLWSIEPVRGYNLRCWHCAVRIPFPEDGKPRFMDIDTWTALCKVIADTTPHTRLELVGCGEPTLHPRLLECLRIAKEITPTTQLQVTTNGKTLIAGKITHEEMFKAGAHSVYVDMYDPVEKHVRLAAAAGVEWYLYNKPKIGSDGHKRKAFTYYDDPDMKLIILQNCPEDRIRFRKAGRLATWSNNLNWNAAIPHGLVPVREPYERKCTIPFRYSVVNCEGYYQFCCTDLLSETAGLMGNVKEGPDSFRRYWFGRLMQSIRRRLAMKDRAGIPYCCRCNCAFAKCDWTGMWPDGSFEQWWDRDGWQDMPPLEMDDEVFADGWEKKRLSDAKLPTMKQEAEILKHSRERIIRSTAAVDKTKGVKKQTGLGLFQ